MEVVSIVGSPKVALSFLGQEYGVDESYSDSK
jgi:hypothetical protein